MKTRVIGGDELEGGGFAALPDGSGPHPGVVVIHEAYGRRLLVSGDELFARHVGSG